MMTDMDQTGEIVQTGRAARLLGVEPSTVRRLAETGKLRYIRKLPGRVGGYLFDESDVEALAAQRRAELQARIDRMSGVA
ncbi:helix-turn-helix domain-containing protein [Demequina sp.]|uniref:helix-turn-helix domain-containing protein n=1 Tax=Demequina sp. TaxID=2050685 RepID=UPI0025BA056B|nr:helix-turn-helix domain-containing protein [Demequina sp.]